MTEPHGPAPFAEVALPFLDDVARVARWLARDPAAADDLVQETFLRALRSWDTFRPGTDCRRWLLTICRNTHYSHHRRARRETTTGDDAELEALAAADIMVEAAAGGLAAVFDHFDLADAVRREVDALDEPFRETVVLVDLQDCSYAEAADVLGVPVGTVRSRLFRARRLLQERLLAHAHDAGLGGPIGGTTR
jgi:RNA polymerase sigma-70 factor (ECF subfamily)